MRVVGNVLVCCLGIVTYVLKASPEPRLTHEAGASVKIVTTRNRPATNHRNTLAQLAGDETSYRSIASHDRGRPWVTLRCWIRTGT